MKLYNKTIQKWASTIVGGSGSGETNALLNLITHETDINSFFIH